MELLMLIHVIKYYEYGGLSRRVNLVNIFQQG